MTRRLKCRIDPEQRPYTCMPPQHKPVRRGREMIDLLAVEEPKPKPAKIPAVSYEAAIDQLFKRMRSKFVDWRMSFSENRCPLFRDMR